MIDTSFRVVVLAPAVSQPRHHRRVHGFLKDGLAVSVYAFRRGYYECNAFPSEALFCDLGKVRSGQYWRRVPQLMEALLRVRASEAGCRRRRVIYAFGLDMAMLGMHIRRKGDVVVYEVGDLRNVTAGVRALLVRALERKILMDASLLVVTAPGFLDAYYRDLCPQAADSALVLENCLSRGALGSLGSRPDVAGVNGKERSGGRRIRFGYVGFLRQSEPLIQIIRAVGRHEAYEMQVYGDGPFAPAVKRLASALSNVEFCGPFRNPEDLRRIYSQLDLNLCVYDSHDANVRVALPNKFYESMYFGVPMVASNGTELGRRVLELGAGCVVDLYSEAFAERLLAQCEDRALLEKWRRAAGEVPTSRLLGPVSLMATLNERLGSA